MDKIILTTPDQLQQYIGQAVEAIIPLLAEHQKKATERPPKERLSLIEAIEYLNELGVSTTRSSIYNHAFRGKIPYHKIGKRYLFYRSELREWVESRTQHPDDLRVEAVHRIAQCANRKLNKR